MTIPAMQAAARKVYADESDVVLFHGSDSTNNEDHEPFRLFADLLPAKHPTHSVVWHEWTSPTSPGWATPEPLSVGTGSNSIHCWNMSVAGKHWHYFQQHAAAIAALQADVLMFALGHNEGSTDRQQLWWGKQLDTIEPLLADWYSSIVLISQNPQRDHDRQQRRAQWNIELAARRGYGIIDVCSAFLADPNWQTLLLSGDGIHPKPEGSLLAASKYIEAWDSFDPDDQPATQPPSTFYDTATQLLTNPLLETVNGTVQGWQPFNVTSTEVTGEYTQPAVELTAVAAQQSYLSQTIPGTTLAPYRGQTVYLAARTRKQTGAPLKAGSVGVTTGGSDGYLERTVGNDIGDNVWHWVGFPYYVPETASSLQVRLYADTSATAGTKAVYDRVGLFLGTYPHDPLNL